MTSAPPVSAATAAVAVAVAALATIAAVAALAPRTAEPGTTAARSRSLPPRLPAYIPFLGNAVRLGINANEFVRNGHARYGDVFLTRMLGYDVVFIGGALLPKAAAASDRFLDMSKAYHIILGSVLGDDAFIDDTPSMAKALTATRIETMTPTIAHIAAAAINDRFVGQMGVINLSSALDEIVAIVGLSIICGFEYSLKHGARFAKLLHILENDFSFFGLLVPIETHDKRRRAKAREEMTALLDEYIRGRIRDLENQPIKSDDDYFTRIIHNVYYGRRDSDEDEAVAEIVKATAATAAESDTGPVEIGDDDHHQDGGGVGGNITKLDADRNETNIHNIVTYAFTLIFAAHTNTAVSISCVMMQILKNPQYMDTIRNEADAYLGDDLLDASKSYLTRVCVTPKGQPKETSPFLRMVHTNRVISETVRVFGTGSLMRYAVQDFVLSDDYYVPKGSLVAISARMCSLNSEFYGSVPETWDPRRFDSVQGTQVGGNDGKLTARVSVEQTRDVDGVDTGIDKAVFVGKLDDLQSPSTGSKNLQVGTFGCGRHLCPGRFLAYRIVSVLTVTLLRRFDMELVHGLTSLHGMPFADDEWAMRSRRPRRRWRWLPGVASDSQTFVAAAIFMLAYIPISTLIFVFDPWLRPYSFVSGVVVGIWICAVMASAGHYYMCVATGPGVVPRRWETPATTSTSNGVTRGGAGSSSEDTVTQSFLRPSDSNSSIEFAKKRSWIDLTEDLETQNPVDNRYCRFCEIDKPPRAHHCRRCNRCILRMDHHCPWIGGCVGFHNQGHFNRFIFSTAFASTMSFGLIAGRLYWLSVGLTQATAAELDHLSVLFTALNITILVPLSSIMCMLSYNQLRLLLLNRTTIEDAEIKDDDFLMSPVRESHPYDLGWYDNIIAVMGRHPVVWFFPQRMHGDGITYRHRGRSI